MAALGSGGPGDLGIPDALPVLPLRDAVVFPLTVVPLAMAEPRAIRLVDEVMRGNRLLALAAQRTATEPTTPDDVHRIATMGAINQLGRMPDGSVRIMVQGIERIRLLDWVATEPYVIARVEAAREPMVHTAEVDGLRRAVVSIFRRLVEASPELPDDLAVAAENLGDTRHLIYFTASMVPLDTAARQELLELDPLPKLRRLIDVLQREVAVRELGRKITTDTEQQLSKKQREFYLREQLRSIQRELGEEEGGGGGVAELRRRIEEAGLTDEARREARRSTGWDPCRPGGSSSRPGTRGSGP